ncbi:hypothetical protein M422DRAFT_227310, partial [Sphaerobolus stellatus SS14]
MSNKRASPGAEVTLGPEISDEDAQKLTKLGKDIAAREVVLERRALEYLQPHYENRRPILKTIKDFWPRAFRNMSGTSLHLQHQQDLDALAFLEDLWIVRDKDEPRCFTIEFHFKENPFFSDSVLKKEYKYLAPQVEDGDKEVLDGVTNANLEFDFDQHGAPQAIKIQWKD